MSLAYWLWGKKITLLKRTPTSNNPKVSNVVPGIFCLAQQGRRQLKPAVPTSSALWASQHFLPLSSFGGLISIFTTLAHAAWEAGDLLGVSEVFTHNWSTPKRCFQSPCECLKPHTSVFGGTGRLQLALHYWGQVCLPVTERRSMSSSSSSFVWCVAVEKSQVRPCPHSGWSPGSLQCTRTVFLGFPGPPALPPSRPSLHILSPGNSDTIPWKPNPQASVSCSCSPVTQDRQSLWHEGFAKVFRAVIFYGRLHKTLR